MAELHALITGLAMGESPRWHNGRLWLADWGASEVLVVDGGMADGQRTGAVFSVDVRAPRAGWP